MFGTQGAYFCVIMIAGKIPRQAIGLLHTTYTPSKRARFPDVLFSFWRTMKTVDPFYRSKRWEHLRAKVLRRDGYKCRECIRYGKHKSAEVVHHAVPRSDFPELQWESWNLVSLCNTCHEHMHTRTTDELSAAGRDLAIRTLRKAGHDIGYLRELAQRRTEGAGLV